MQTRWIFDRTRLKAHRELIGLSPEQVGKAIGKSGQCIKNWESGKGSPNACHLVNLGNALSINPQQFFVKQPGKGYRERLVETGSKKP